MGIIIGGDVFRGDENRIDLSESPLTSEDIKKLSEIKSLAVLNLTDCGVTDISPLAELPGLAGLNIIGNSVDFSPLAGLEKLESLCADSGSTGIEKLTRLKDLALCGFAERGFITGMKSLEKLSLYGCEIESLAAEAECESLKTLCIYGDGRGRIRFNAWELSRLKNIGALYISGCNGCAEYAGELTNLKELAINSSDRLSDISPLGRLTGLEKLVLVHDAISDITPLRGLTELVSLYLDGNRISDISAVSAMKKLERFFAEMNRIESAAPLAGLTELRELSLYRNPVSDITPLLDFKKLERCNLDMTRVTAADAELLKKAYPFCKFGL